MKGDALAGPLFGVCVLAGVLIGESLAPRPDGTMRVASLKTRRVRDHVRDRSLLLPAAPAIALAGFLAMASAVGASHTHVLADGAHGVRFSCSGIVSEFPDWVGLQSAVHILTVITVGAGLCLLALRKIATRAPVSPEPALQSADRALRASSAKAVTSAWGSLTAASLLTTSLTTGTYLRWVTPLTQSQPARRPPWSTSSCVCRT